MALETPWPAKKNEIFGNLVAHKNPTTDVKLSREQKGNTAILLALVSVKGNDHVMNSKSINPI